MSEQQAAIKRRYRRETARDVIEIALNVILIISGIAALITAVIALFRDDWAMAQAYLLMTGLVTYWLDQDRRAGR